MSEFASGAIVHGYIDDVLDGRLPACKWVRLACERHLHDLETGAERGLSFNPAAAQQVINFVGLLKHSKGEWAGQLIRLEPWQQFCLWVLFGWKREVDGMRRFRTSYWEIARKNGKTLIAAAVGLFLLVADGEPGAEIYTAATKKDQARLSHSEATRMVKSSPSLRKRVRVFRDNLHIENTASKFEPVGRDADTMDGFNVHGAIVDELHAHKTRDTWDILDTATGSRRQPLMFAITTAGHNRQSVCYEQRKYTQRILDGLIEDDTFFGIIFTLDEGDDWEDEGCWIKANPNLGVSKKWDDLRRKAAKAKELPSELNSFLRKHLDLWTQSETKWLPQKHWDACGGAVDAVGLRGRTCYIGVDLSSTTDTASEVVVFPPQVDGEPYQALCRFFVPGDAIAVRSKRDRVPYDAWVRQGYITATPGNVVDYSHILGQLLEDVTDYDVRLIGYDPWNATQFAISMQDAGLEIAEMRQGYKTLSPPTKALERLILSHELAHGNNPVLNWMADNVVVLKDAAGNIKPAKDKSLERIDGIVALVMALDLALRNKKQRSVYEDRGIRVL